MIYSQALTLYMSHVTPCHVMSCQNQIQLDMSCHAMSCHVLTAQTQHPNNRSTNSTYIYIDKISQGKIQPINTFGNTVMHGYDFPPRANNVHPSQWYCSIILCTNILCSAFVSQYQPSAISSGVFLTGAVGMALKLYCFAWLCEPLMLPKIYKQIHIMSCWVMMLTLTTCSHVGLVNP